MVRPAFFLVCLAAAIGCASAQHEVRLIVRGDDMGFSHSANLACIEAFQKGIMRTVEVITPGPWFPEAVRLLQKNPGLDVGVHLTLTAEWETLKWRPLTRVPSLTGPHGYFLPMVWPSENYPEPFSIKGREWKLDEIEQELRAQIETAKAAIPQASHVSSHMGFGSLDSEIARLVERLAAEYGLNINPPDFGVRDFPRYRQPRATAEEEADAFIAALEGLEPGTYLLVDHPAFDDGEMRGVHHIGYEDVAQDRQKVTTVWTSDRVEKALAGRNILLIAYRDLKTR